MARLDAVYEKLVKVQEALRRIGEQMAKNPLSKGDEVKKFNEDLSKSVATTRDLAAATKAYNEAVRETDVLIQKIKSAKRGTLTKLRAEYAGAVAKEKLLKKVMVDSEKVTAKRAGTVAALSAEIALNNVKIRESIDFTKKLSAADKRLITDTRKLERQLSRYERRVRGVVAAQRGLNASFRRSVEGVTFFATSFVGLTALLYAAARGFTDFIRVTREYGKGSATLAGILGVTTDELEDMDRATTSIAERLPVTTIEVRKLQISLARLGFTLQEVNAMTEPIVEGSIAMGGELDEMANLVGAVIRAFDDLEAIDAPRIVDAMTRSTTLSALNFEKLFIILPQVSGAASGLNYTFEEMLAHLGVINNTVQRASITYTSYRRILLRLKQQNIELSEAMALVRKASDPIAESLRLVGVRSAVALRALADGTDDIRRFEKELRNAANTAEEMAQKQIQTLDGAIKSLNATWTAFVTDLQNSEGAFAVAVKGLAGLLMLVRDEITGDAILAEFGVEASPIWDGLGVRWNELVAVGREFRGEQAAMASATDEALDSMLTGYKIWFNELDTSGSTFDALLGKMIAVQIGMIEMTQHVRERRRVTDEDNETTEEQVGIIEELRERLKALGEELASATTTKEIASIVTEMHGLTVVLKDFTTYDPIPTFESWETRLARMEKRAEEAAEAAREAAIEWKLLQEEWRDEEERPQEFAEEFFDEIYGGAADFARQALLEQEGFENQSYQRQLEMLKWLNDNKLIEQAQYEAAMARLRKKEREIAEDEAALINAATQELVTNLSQVGQAMTEDVEAKKAIATAEAIIMTYLGAAKAASSTPNPVANAILAAAQVALGLAQVIQIQNTNIPQYAEGTEYLERGSNPKGKDTIPVMANEGERIVPTEINKQLMGISNNALPGIVHMGIAYNEGVVMVLKKQLREVAQTNKLLRGLQWEDHDGSYVDLEGNRKKYVN